MNFRDTDTKHIQLEARRGRLPIHDLKLKFYVAGFEHGKVKINGTAARVVAMCKNLHLEASELIEAVKDKRSDLLSEAGGALLVLMSITENKGIPFADVIAAAEKKLTYLEACKRYEDEENTK